MDLSFLNSRNQFNSYLETVLHDDEKHKILLLVQKARGSEILTKDDALLLNNVIIFSSDYPYLRLETLQRKYIQFIPSEKFPYVAFGKIHRTNHDENETIKWVINTLKEICHTTCQSGSDVLPNFHIGPKTELYLINAANWELRRKWTL